MIDVETKTIVDKRTYTCDILFVNIEPEDIYITFDDHLCCSKEAAKRLPKSVVDNATIFKYILYGCGRKQDQFDPDWLHTGLWVLEVPTSDYGFIARLTNNSNNKQFHQKDSPTCFKDEKGVMDWIQKRCDLFGESGFRYWVFKDGELVMTLKSQCTPIMCANIDDNQG